MPNLKPYIPSDISDGEQYEQEQSVPVDLRRDGTVAIGDAVFTVNNIRTDNVVNDLINMEQTVDLTLVLTRPIPKQEQR